MEFPDPVIELAIEPKSKADQEKMGVALQRLAQEDPSFRVSTDQESGQTILKGMGELHLEIKVDILKRTYKVDANVGAPQVAYRETLSRPVTSITRTRNRPAARANIARSQNHFRAAAAGFGLRVRKRRGGRLGAEGVHPVGRKGHQGAEGIRLAGRLSGDRLQGDADRRRLSRSRQSNALTFDIAARAAFRELAQRGAVKLLEPIMKVEVVTPDDFLGGVIGDLNSRRGQVQGTDSRGNAQIVTAMVPLANMFGYINTLRSMTPGKSAIFHAVRSLRAGAAGDRR